MKLLKDQIPIIRSLIAQGALKDALAKLRQLAEGSPKLNEIILQSARFNSLQMNLLTGSISYQDQDIARNQIANAVLELLSDIDKEIGGMEGYWQKEMENTLDEIIRKHGVPPDVHQRISAHRNAAKTYRCLWIDDQPGNDKMEMQAIMSMGLEWRSAANPFEAYAILKSEIPDVIVINSLSRLRDNPREGIEFCKFLFLNEKYKHIPVLLHSISFQRDWDQASNKEAMHSDLPGNIRNCFKKKNTLVIRDLIEEIARVVFVGA